MKFEQPNQGRDFLTIHDKLEIFKHIPASMTDLIEELVDPDLNDEDFNKLVENHNQNTEQPQGEMMWYAFDIKTGRALEIGVDKKDETRVKLGSWKPKL